MSGQQRAIKMAAHALTGFALAQIAKSQIAKPQAAKPQATKPQIVPAGRPPAKPAVRPAPDLDPAHRAPRLLNRSASVLALSVLIDSAVEHYRGSFKNPAMHPIALSALTLAAGMHGTSDRRSGAHRLRTPIYVAAALTGLAGTGFHIYNILKRPGRLAWQNLFYGAPAGAPMAIFLAGALGSAAEQARNRRPGAAARIFGLPAGRVISALSGLGLLGTTAEAALLHFRGAFHNPAMLLPVTLPPGAGALLLRDAVTPGSHARHLTRWWLRLTGLLGVIGTGFHIWGVQRSMGGWRNWRQNLLDGPPVPAPPSFTGLALAGLAALDLLEDRPDA